MTTMPDTIPTQPIKLRVAVDPAALEGANQRYEKFLRDLVGLYQDSGSFDELLAADDGRPVYWVDSSQTEEGPGSLITGISVIEPGRVGDEFAMTRGHLHRQADRSELYLGVAGVGVMLLETIDGRSEAVEMRAGEAVYVPGHWVHRSVNVGAERLVMLFCYAGDAGQDYGIIERAGGMKQLVVTTDAQGWTTRPNPAHRGYKRDELD